MRIYISGKISNLPRREYLKHFREAHKELLESGFKQNEIVSPIPMGEAYYYLGYDLIMHLDLALLEKCDAIYMLKNHVDSEGARTELLKARKLGLKIFYQGEEIKFYNGNKQRKKVQNGKSKFRVARGKNKKIKRENGMFARYRSQSYRR